MNGSWIELEFIVDGERVDAWSDALLAAGALSVQVEDADADGESEQPIFGEPGEPPPAPGWQRSRLLAMFEGDPQDPLAAVALLAQAADIAGEAVPPSSRRRVVAERDWVGETQAQFAPIEIGPRLRISPSWHRVAESDRERTIVLDPGLAFGTGSHPTTRMCLRWLERALPSGVRVIDYGCGSGILAIAAARLGAREVVAIDIDEQALASTADNAAANQVAIEVRSSRDPAPAPADIVLANILANPLKLLAPMLEGLLRPGGTILLAGLLERQVDEVAACYARCHIEVDQVDEGWACLRGTRQA
ncbi:MAG: 50S ribosomal protein L11 methyltransferase [Burkholderiaceae bacterium]